MVQAWVDAFNRGDAEALASLYNEDAPNHQVAQEPVVGREAIRRMFSEEFARADMVCLVENLFQDGEWAILEWRDPLGLRGCGFFHVVGRSPSSAATGASSASSASTGSRCPRSRDAPRSSPGHHPPPHGLPALG